MARSMALGGVEPLPLAAVLQCSAPVPPDGGAGAAADGSGATHAADAGRGETHRDDAGTSNEPDRRTGAGVERSPVGGVESTVPRAAVAIAAARRVGRGPLLAPLVVTIAAVLWHHEQRPNEQ